MKKNYLALGCALLALSACVDRRSFETEPVAVETEEGTVWCQLYTRGIVMWDHATRHPINMLDQEANAYCVNKGETLLQLQNRSDA